MELLPFELQHIYQLDRLPAVHRDPFDRLLVAQAQVEDLPLISADSVVAGYDVRIIW